MAEPSAKQPAESSAKTPQSFFGRLRGAFKNSYRGRYLATILAELSNNDTKIVRELVDVNRRAGRGKLRFIPEYKLPGKNRFADLALVDDVNQLVGLVEIKAGDEKCPRNAAQFSDYLLVARRNNIAFTLLTYTFPASTDLRDLRKTPRARHLLVGRIGERLASRPGLTEKQRIIRGLLYDYLKEEGLVMESIYRHEQGLRQLLRWTFHPDYASRQNRLNRKAFVEDTPNFLRAATNNITILGESIRYIIQLNRQPTLDLAFHPYVQPDKCPQESPGGVDLYLPDEARAGGDLYVRARFHIGQSSKAYLYISFGYYFTLYERGHLESGLFAEVYGQNEKDGRYLRWKEVRIGPQDRLADFARCQKQLIELLKQSVNSWLTYQSTNQHYRSKNYAADYINRMSNCLASLERH